jgi:RNA polymerase sigma factor (sigma-70 family)
MDDLAEAFQRQRPRLEAVAYRMLGSVAEAQDAVQDTWLRLSRSDADGIRDLSAWLTTVVARTCLNVLRSRRSRPEQGPLPDPVVTPDEDAADPEAEAVLADSVGLAMMLVLDSLPPAERVAFVLHDLFDLPFEQIADMVGRTPTAARQLASRGRRRVRGADLPEPDPDRRRQRRVVDAFYAAARGGDLAALALLLDPDVVLRADFGAARRPVQARGIDEVTRMARAPRGAVLHPVLVNGRAGAVVTIDGRVFSIMGFTVVGDRIAEIDSIADPQRVRALTRGLLLT